MYKSTPAPENTEDLKSFLDTELQRLTGNLDFLKHLRVSRDYDLSASASVEVADEQIPTKGLVLLSMAGGGVPTSTAFQVHRDGTNNGCYAILATATANQWGFGTTTEPGVGSDARAWINSVSVGASLRIKNMTANNRSFRLLSVEV